MQTNNFSRILNSIHTRIILAFSLLVLITSITEFFAYKRVKDLHQGALRGNFQTIQSLVGSLKESSSQFMLKGKSDLTFFETGETINLIEYDSIFNKLDSVLQQTKAELIQTGVQDTSDLNQLELELNDFDSVFSEIKALVRSRGFGQHGVIGEFEKSLIKLSEFNFREDNSSILRLKIYVKEYLLTRNIAIAQDVKNETYRFTTVLEKYITDEQVNEVLLLLGGYELAFRKLVTIDTTLGIGTNSGLEKALFEKISSINQKVQLTATQQNIDSAYNDILNNVIFSLAIIFITILLLAFLTLYSLYRGIISPIAKIQHLIHDMSEGIIPEKIPQFKTSEAQSIGHSVRKLKAGIQRTTEFATCIGQGKFDANYTPLSNKDILGLTLLDMQKNLKQYAHEENQIKWANDTMLQLLSIFQIDKQHIEELSQQSLNFIINRFSAVRGALFISEKFDTTISNKLKVIAHFAHDHQPSQLQKVELGIGLVGTCAEQNQVIYHENISSQQIAPITTSSSQMQPQTIILLPLNTGKHLIGVLEINSFHPFTQHQQKLLEDIANRLAIQLQNIQINIGNQLLTEELQSKNHELLAQQEELRQTSEELYAINESLEARVKKRTEEIEKAYKSLKETQTQLVQSEKMASLGQMTAGIAHEINNPINFVQGGVGSLKIIIQELIEILEKYELFNQQDTLEDFLAKLQEVEDLKEQLNLPELKEDIFHLIEDITNGASRTTEIIRSLRNFSRLDEGKLQPCNIHESIDATLTILKGQIGKRIQISKQYDPFLSEINCYPGQIGQLLMNILTNAIQAIEGKGEITIDTHNFENTIEISILDSGPGIPEEVRQKIFDPFFTTKEIGKGTGLGLSISYGIIEKHQGSIDVKSIEGEGTEFIITIPKNL